MKRWKQLGVAVALASITTLAVAGHSTAISGGDADGEQHPNVGIILMYTAEGLFRCTATLIAPDVLLTAAHCTDGTIGKTIVSFDTDIAQSAPSGVPTADPAVGYTSSPGLVNGKTWYAGTAVGSPDYSDFTDLANWNDYAVVVLDAPIVGIDPAQLAPVGYLDQFRQPKLNKTLFTMVGYGTRIGKPDTGPQKARPLSFPLIRRTTTAPGQKLTPQIIQLNGNVNDTRGGGGSCFGDSGGPLILNGYVVGVTSYGYTANCRYIDGYQRIDLKIAQDFIAANS
jgi:hypothetical protein